ncbi:hypothetical protein P9112_003102 [Eukaryota sp. TZLM1-RC]
MANFSTHLATPPVSFNPHTEAPVIDAVYTWVNSSDPSFQSSLSKFSTKSIENNRYREFNELKYSLRSLELYAPWIRKVFLITDRQIPTWLNTRHPKLTVIDHRDLFDPSLHSFLPVFSSPAIEAQFHRLSSLGVSDHFIYFNDDFFLGSPITPFDLVSPRGQSVFPTWPVPECSPGCSSAWIGDGRCDGVCNNKECGFDGGDCEGVETETATSSWSWQSETSNNAKYCSTGCFVNWVGDGMCDTNCNNKECGFDGGDCSDDEVASQEGQNGDVIEVLIDDKSLIVDVSVNNSFVEVEYKPIDFAVEDEQKFSLNCIWKVFFNHSKQKLYVVLRPRDHLTNALKELSSISNIKVTKFDHKIRLIDEDNVLFGMKIIVVINEEDETPQKMDQKDQNEAQNDDPVNDIPDDIEEKEEEVDAYSDSLRHVDMILSSKFGPVGRRVPAHMPYLIQLPVLQDCFETFKENFLNTSKNRFRSSNDVQFGLMYYQFLQEVKRSPQSWEFYFDLYDVNSDGFISGIEARRLLADLFDPVNQNSIDWLQKVVTGQTTMSPMQYVQNSTNSESFFDLAGSQLNALSKFGLSGSVITHHDENYKPLDFSLFKISRFKFSHLTIVIDTLNEIETSKNKYQFVIEDLDDVAFHPLTDNAGEVSRVLDSIRRRRPKFICLNDDLSSEPNRESVRLVSEFLDDYFNVPSSFEDFSIGKQSFLRLFLVFSTIVLVVFICLKASLRKQCCLDTRALV